MLSHTKHDMIQQYTYLQALLFFLCREIQNLRGGSVVLDCMQCRGNQQFRSRLVQPFYPVDSLKRWHLRYVEECTFLIIFITKRASRCSLCCFGKDKYPNPSIKQIQLINKAYKAGLKKTYFNHNLSYSFANNTTVALLN